MNQPDLPPPTATETDATTDRRPRLSLHDHSECHPADVKILDRLALVLEHALPLVLQSPGTDPCVLPELEEVEVSLLDDAAMAAVHGEFFNDPTPTDVITFQHGEILVGVETAVREAADRGGQAGRETALYMIHGLLHLHGHIDTESEARAAMHAVQDHILQTVWPVRTARVALLLATHNAHKTAEVRAILGERYKVSDLTAWPGAPEPDESGATFSENAAIKALAACALVGPDIWVLADDSGLEVDALDGAPGVQSARYSGRHGDNAGHRAKLLSALEQAGARDDAQRRGRFRCVLALARAGRVMATFEGTVEGRISHDERGAGGFGYDPIFIPEGENATFGELPDSVKNALSHRARALAALASSGVLEASIH